MNKALKIDIEKELKANKHGECLACRIGSTHKPQKECYNPGNYQKMKHCPKCNYLFNFSFFANCPICEELEGRQNELSNET